MPADPTLHLRRPLPARLLGTLGHALTLDSASLLRLRPHDDTHLDVFVSTPLRTLIHQRIPGTLPSFADAGSAPIDLVWPTSQVRERLRAATSQPGPEDQPLTVDCGEPSPLLWPGALPPFGGYELIDHIPARDVRDLYRSMGQEQASHGGPAGLARSLIDQALIEVSAADGPTVQLTGAIIAVLGAAQLIAEPSDPRLTRYDYVRVSASASWIRVDALFGSTYTPRPGGLARTP